VSDNLGASEESRVLAAERDFFAALAERYAETLNRLLADDFMLIDVLSGSAIAKLALLDALKSGLVKFEEIAPTDTNPRLYQRPAVISGRTNMKGRFGEIPFAVYSRYTHV
jgi:hypothetical protein